MKKVLTIAGFDPSSGAGITKDLEVFFALGIHGLSIPTVLTVQGPTGVRNLSPIPLEFFKSNLDIMEKLGIDGIKIGILWRKSYAELLFSFMEGKNIPSILDPVFESKNGFSFIDDECMAFLKIIIPKVTCITPNIPEARRLTGLDIRDAPDMEKAAESIFHMGAKGVILKGGHRDLAPLDLCFDGENFSYYERKKIGNEIHGTGCIFSSLVLSFLVFGYPLREAFFEAENYMDEVLRERYRIDKEGFFYCSLAFLSKQGEKMKILEVMRRLKEKLEGMDFKALVPEVQMNIVYAMREAKGIEDVAAFPGRIGTNKGKIYIKGEPEFGASSHVARLIIEYMKYFPYMRSCANIRYDPDFIRKAQSQGLKVAFFDRKNEPESIKKEEGQSLPFHMSQVLKYMTSPPDIIYDLGDQGKEPIIRLFGREPFEILKKMEILIA